MWSRKISQSASPRNRSSRKSRPVVVTTGECIGANLSRDSCPWNLTFAIGPAAVVVQTSGSGTGQVILRSPQRIQNSRRRGDCKRPQDLVHYRDIMQQFADLRPRLDNGRYD